MKIIKGRAKTEKEKAQAKAKNIIKALNPKHIRNRIHLLFIIEEIRRQLYKEGYASGLTRRFIRDELKRLKQSLTVPSVPK